MERSPLISWVFHLRAISLLFSLLAVDAFFVRRSWISLTTRGPSVEIVFGLEVGKIEVALVINNYRGIKRRGNYATQVLFFFFESDHVDTDPLHTIQIKLHSLFLAVVCHYAVECHQHICCLHSPLHQPVQRELMGEQAHLYEIR